MSYRETWPAVLYNHRKWQLIGRANGAVALMRPSIVRAERTTGPAAASSEHTIAPISIHQMAPSEWTSDCSLLLIYRPRKDKRLSKPSWLAWSARFTHITGHSSDASRAQDRENLQYNLNIVQILPTVMHTHNGHYGIVQVLLVLVLLLLLLMMMITMIIFTCFNYFNTQKSTIHKK